MRALETLLEKQKRELAKSQGLLAEVEEQVKGVQTTRDEVRNMMEGKTGETGAAENGAGEGRSTTPDVEPPVPEALTPPPMTKETEVKGNEFAGLESLDPEIVALLQKDMGLQAGTSGNGLGRGSGDQEMNDEYAP